MSNVQRVRFRGWSIATPMMSWGHLNLWSWSSVKKLGWRSGTGVVLRTWEDRAAEGRELWACVAEGEALPWFGK